MNGEKQYWGKYPGTVVDNDDKQSRGRLKVKVPTVLAENESTWALPCVPYAGKGVGLFLIPPVESLVWVEFQQGNPQLPIWSGCYWAEKDMPGSPDNKVLKTSNHSITLNDKSGSESITIEAKGGLKIIMDSNGIEISNGSQKITLSSDTVSVNDGALEVQ